MIRVFAKNGCNITIPYKSLFGSFWFLKSFCNDTLPLQKMVKVLNVAEKNDAAKSLADVLSRGAFQRREGLSRYNKIYEFGYNLWNKQCSMVMTSLSGHLLGYEFSGQYRNWTSCNPVALFDAPLTKSCSENFLPIKNTLEREIKNSFALIIWTDCDREGENIGFEVIDVCLAVKPNVKVYRARFSEITPRAVQRAIDNLQQPDKKTSDAVDVRQELDLRIGAAFTRFQTLRLKKVFPDVLADQLISYGSCQFPTLGFVVERYKQIEQFVVEPFWKLKVSYEFDEGTTEFSWKRVRLHEMLACLALYQNCIENPIASVTDTKCKPKSKWRPTALDTVELEKLASRKLHINAKETMKIAERLYTKGYISYPRTETNKFPPDLDLVTLIQNQTADPHWGQFAGTLLQRGPTPRNGTKSDQAHPPIHPTKYSKDLQGDDKKIYEFVVRHFLACCSQDAQGMETIIDIDIADEQFVANGLMITAKNYLDVYPYDRWNAKIIPHLNKGDKFTPSSIEMVQGATSPPSLLTEADLIALMDKHGIGTDATHAEHIETIKSRLYVGVDQSGRFVPGELGMGLVEGYDSMGYEMSKPHLRANLENDLKLICDGHKSKEEVKTEQILKYKEVFIKACEQAEKIDLALSHYFGNRQTVSNADIDVPIGPSVKPCNLCRQEMILKNKKDKNGFFILCMGYPECRSAIWLPDFVLEASVNESVCEICKPGPVHKLNFKFKKGSVPAYIPLNHCGCVGGCDSDLNEILDLRKPANQPVNQTSSNTNQRSLSSTQPSRSQPYSDTGYNSGRSDRISQPSRNQSSVDTSYMSGRNNQQSSRSQSFIDAGYSSSRNNQQSSRSQSFTDAGYSSGRNSQSLSSSRSQSISDGSYGSGKISLTPQTSSLKSTNHQTLPKPSTQFDSLQTKENQNNIVCNCGLDAHLKTVRKEGPNQGRGFYCCPKAMSESCGFFLWADTPSVDQQATRAPFSNSSSMNVQPTPTSTRSFDGGGSSTVNNVKCSCNINAVSRTVFKDGPNKGRLFYCCPKPRENSENCGFFKWADEVDSSSNQSHGYPKKSKPQLVNTNQTGVKRKRKCGQCGQEGHTKKTCPFNK